MLFINQKESVDLYEWFNQKTTTVANNFKFELII